MAVCRSQRPVLLIPTDAVFLPEGSTPRPRAVSSGPFPENWSSRFGGKDCGPSGVGPIIRYSCSVAPWGGRISMVGRLASFRTYGFPLLLLRSTALVWGVFEHLPATSFVRTTYLVQGARSGMGQARGRRNDGPGGPCTGNHTGINRGTGYRFRGARGENRRWK